MRVPACADRANPFYRGDRAWSLPWCTRADDPIFEQHRVRCTHPATTKFASIRTRDARAKVAAPRHCGARRGFRESESFFVNATRETVQAARVYSTPPRSSGV